jgi:transcriptional regulator GlxA family with amidase domain
MELQISNLLHQIITEILSKTENKSHQSESITETLRYLVKYMENNYKSRLTLDYLSKFSGVSKYYLCREFKKYTGFSPNEYLIRLRIEQSKLLLQKTNISIERIAELVGIPDENNFSRHFKKLEGTTPGHFREG